MSVRPVPAPLALALALAVAVAVAACAHGPVSAPPGAREPWPEEARLDGRALVLPDFEAETVLRDPRPARTFPEATVYAAAVAELLRDSALEVFGGLFRQGAATAPDDARREGFRAVVSPRALRAPGAPGLAVSISVTVQLLDARGEPIREERIDGGTLQGPADFPPGVAGPRIGRSARDAIDRLVRRAAEATREASVASTGG